ncbi:MAG: TIGR00725 family protein [Bacillota bacterium]
MFYLAVVGGSSCTDKERELARKTGKEIAIRGAVLLCGGGSGVMEAVSAGASEEGGLVIGILPGGNRYEGNNYLTAAVATGMGEARNAIITRTADAVIAIGGEYGTLSEIALALKMGKPVIGLKSWSLSPPHEVKDGIIETTGAEEAVKKAFSLIQY